MDDRITIEIHKWMLFFTDPGAKSVSFILKNGGGKGNQGSGQTGGSSLILS